MKRRFKRSKGRNLQAENEKGSSMSSMIDVVFLLLIFFIVTQTTILDVTHLKVNLPTGDGEPGKSVPFRIDVTKVIADNPEKDLNYYIFNNRVYPFDAVKELLANFQEDNTATLIISCGPNARHEKLIKLLNACQQAELTNLSIVNNDLIPFGKN